MKLRNFFFFFLFIVVLVISFFFFLPSIFFSSQKIRNFVVDKLESRTKSSISYQVSFPPDYQVPFFSLSRDIGIFRELDLKGATLFWNRWAFLKGLMEVERAELEFLRFQAIAGKIGLSHLQKLLPSRLRVNHLKIDNLEGDLSFPHWDLNFQVRNAEVFWNSKMKGYSLRAKEGQAVISTRNFIEILPIVNLEASVNPLGASVEKLKLADKKGTEFSFSILWSLLNADYLLNLLVNYQNFSSLNYMPYSSLSLQGNLKGHLQIQGNRANKVGLGQFEILDGVFSHPWGHLLFQPKDASLYNEFPFTQGEISFSFDRNSFQADQIFLKGRDFSLKSNLIIPEGKDLLLHLDLGLSDSFLAKIPILKKPIFSFNEDGYRWASFSAKRKGNQWKNNLSIVFLEGLITESLSFVLVSPFSISEKILHKGLDGINNVRKLMFLGDEKSEEKNKK